MVVVLCGLWRVGFLAEDRVEEKIIVALLVNDVGRQWWVVVVVIGGLSYLRRCSGGDFLDFPVFLYIFPIILDLKGAHVIASFCASTVSSEIVSLRGVEGTDGGC
jgi:hypothetical protein